MAWIVNLIDAVRTTVATAWPDVATTGVYQTAEIARLTLDFKQTQGKLPFAVVDLGVGEGTEWGAANEVDDCRLTIYYVAQDSTSLDTLVGKLETLRDALYGSGGGGISGAQVIGWPSVAWSLDLPLMEYFLRSQRPYVCGAVVCRVLEGETP